MAEDLSYFPRRLKEFRHAFAQVCRTELPGIRAANSYALDILHGIREQFLRLPVSKEGWAAIAVGGLGRGNLSFLSNLDLLLLHERRLPGDIKRAIRELTFSLSDSGFDARYIVASLSSGSDSIRTNFSFLTTYLETQFVGGDEVFYQRWQSDFMQSFGVKRRRRFLKDLVAQRQIRLQHYGESPYLLEPNLRETAGGLRDLHVIRWAAKIFFNDPEFETGVENGVLTGLEQGWLERAHDFLWQVRLQLHQITGARQDNLLFPQQEHIAKLLGFPDSVEAMAVEAFMRFYYRHTARICRATEFFLERLHDWQNKRNGTLKPSHKRSLTGPFSLENRRIHFLKPDLIATSPRLLMQFFWQAAKSGARFDHETGSVIRRYSEGFTEQDRCDPEVVKQFFEILLHPRHAFPVLEEMLETGFLEAFMPEFRGVRYRLQDHRYHIYTVDEHLLRTVRKMHQMQLYPEGAPIRLPVDEMFNQLKNPRILYLAALIHDLGKSRGKNHWRTGCGAATDIALRLGLDPGETILLCFLVENHLLLTHTVLKLDLKDEKTVLFCATKIADRQELRQLFLLAIADSCASAPRAWNSWKASLFSELYMELDQYFLLHGLREGPG